MLDLILLFGLQLLFFFLAIFVCHFAFFSAERLSEWLTFKRVIAIFLGTGTVVAIGFLILLKIGWVQYGTPYDSPGFEEDRPSQKTPPEKSGPPPTIKKKVSGENIDSAGEEHKKKLDKFEQDKPK